MAKDGGLLEDRLHESLNEHRNRRQPVLREAAHTACKCGLMLRMNLLVLAEKAVWGAGGGCLSGKEGTQPTSNVPVAGLVGTASPLPGACPILCLTMPVGRLPTKGRGEHLLTEPLLTGWYSTGCQVHKGE